MVRIDTSPLTSDEFRNRLVSRGIDVLVVGPTMVRLVTHWGITAEHIEETGKEMKGIRK